MTKFVRIALLVCGFASAALGQTKSDLSKKYQSISAYEIRPGVLMVAKFDAAGEVCEVTISGNPELLVHSGASQVLTNQLADALVDELSPPSERGQPHEWLNPASTVAGGTYFDKKDYENISVERRGTIGESLQSLKIIWTKRRCDSVAPSASAK